VVPSLGELHELGLLGGLDVGQLVLLGGADVVPLPGDLLFEEFFELGRGFFRLGVVALLLTFASVFLQEAEEVKDLGIRGDGDDALGSALGGSLLRVLPEELLHVLLEGVGVDAGVLARVLKDLVLHLLHEVDELIEGHVLTPSPSTIGVEHCFGLLWVALEAGHDGL
jgi:hypothetical protein